MTNSADSSAGVPPATPALTEQDVIRGVLAMGSLTEPHEIRMPPHDALSFARSGVRDVLGMPIVKHRACPPGTFYITRRVAPGESP